MRPSVPRLWYLTLTSIFTLSVDAAAQHGDVSAVDRTADNLCRLLDWRPPSREADARRSIWLPPSEHIRIVDRPREQELVIEVGPVDVPAHGAHHDQLELPKQLAYFPFDAVIHGFRIEIVDARGRSVPRDVLHHMDTARPTFRELFVPIPQRFLAVSADVPDKQYPAWLIGTPIYAQEPVLVTALFHNPSDTEYRGVRARMIFRYSRRQPLLLGVPFHMDVMFPTGPHYYDVPPGRSERSWEGSPAIPVRLIAVGGHLHSYAQRLELRDVTEDRVIWSFEPTPLRVGDTFTTPAGLVRLGIGVTLEPTHRYRITAVYNNPTRRVLPRGGMAKVAGIGIPLQGASWPAADPTIPLYREDLNFLLGYRCSEKLTAGPQPERSSRQD